MNPQITVSAPLSRPAAQQFVEPRGERFSQSVRRHREASLSSCRSPGAFAVARRRASMSRVIAARSKRGEKPQSSRAALASSDWGQESAIAWRMRIDLVVDGEARDVFANFRGEFGGRDAHGRHIVGVAISQARGDPPP